MSVASLANQMRAACARSSVCKLGSPITPPTPPPPTTLASDSRRTPAVPSGSDRYSAAPQSKIPVRSGNALASSVPAQLAPPRTAASRLLASIFSSNKTAVQTMRAPGKMRPHSLRSVPVLKLHPATWLLLPLCVGSFAKLAAWDTSTQDGVEISLTEVLYHW